MYGEGGDIPCLPYPQFEKMCLVANIFTTKEQSNFLLNLYKGYFANEGEGEKN